MSIEQWWPRLTPESREWLIANNGDVIAPPVLEEITRVAGPISTAAWWVGRQEPSGWFLSDAAVDWIEGAANGEAS